MRYSIYFIILIFLVGCKKEKNNFTVDFNNSKVELVLSENKNFIKYNDTIPVTFHIKNIDLSKLRIIALGLSIGKTNDSTLTGKLFVEEAYKKISDGYIKKDTFYIKVYKIEDGHALEDKIKIPIVH